MLLLVTACGGGDGNGDDAASTPTDSPSNTGDAVDSSDGSGNSAKITIGDMVYEFSNDLSNQCQDNGSMLAGTFAMDADGNPLEGGDANRAVAVNFNITGQDWEAQGLTPPMVSVDDATTNAQWQAGGLEGSSTTIDPEDSKVISLDKGDGQASGTANFYDLKAHFAGQAKAPEQGSFEITCGN